MTPYPVLRNLLFRLAPETAHDLTLRMLRLGVKGPVQSLLRAGQPSDPINVMGLAFPNRVGLAAGLDKNAECIAALAAMGFGCIEVGTVTPRPQPGNPKPRLFRIPEQQAIINRMGFNNKGIEYAVERLRRYRQSTDSPMIVGVNIGKNKTTPNERAADDYLTCLRKAHEYADYIAVNISSPNTPGLRELQYGDELRRLLAALKNEQARLNDRHRRTVPLALKIAPDMDEPALDSVAQNALECELDALIVGNTTLTRPANDSHPLMREAGGLSGRPLMGLSTRILEAMHRRLGDTIPLIGVGGINSAADAEAKRRAGATLVQIYTGFIYHGPGLVRAIAGAQMQEKGQRKKDNFRGKEKG